MASPQPTQVPVALGGAGKRDMRTQFAALCYRMVAESPEILVITSRDTGRWILPKGWPIDGLTPAGAAAREAFEEAGVRGRPLADCLGLYCYTKRLEDGGRLPCAVAVFPVQVTRLEDEFPEAGERRREWLAPERAAGLFDETALRGIVARFDPARLRA